MPDYEFDEDVTEIVISKETLSNILKLVKDVRKYTRKAIDSGAFEMDFHSVLNGEEVSRIKAPRLNNRKKKPHKKSYTEAGILKVYKRLCEDPDYTATGISAGDISAYLNLPKYVNSGIGLTLGKLNKKGLLPGVHKDGAWYPIGGAAKEDGHEGNGSGPSNADEQPDGRERDVPKDTSKYVLLAGYEFTRRLWESGILYYLYNKGFFNPPMRFSYSERGFTRADRYMPLIQSDIRNFMMQSGSSTQGLRVKLDAVRVEFDMPSRNEFRKIIDDIKKYAGIDLLRR